MILGGIASAPSFIYLRIRTPLSGGVWHRYATPEAKGAVTGLRDRDKRIGCGGLSECACRCPIPEYTASAGVWQEFDTSVYVQLRVRPLLTSCLWLLVPRRARAETWARMVTP